MKVVGLVPYFWGETSILSNAYSGPGLTALPFPFSPGGREGPEEEGRGGGKTGVWKEARRTGKRQGRTGWVRELSDPGLLIMCPPSGLLAASLSIPCGPLAPASLSVLPPHLFYLCPSP